VSTNFTVTTVYFYGSSNRIAGTEFYAVQTASNTVWMTMTVYVKISGE
jgi:hypothetical protein